MKRVFFYGDKAIRAATDLLGSQENFNPLDYAKYSELEVALQEDGRFSVWGNLPNDADLLQDTKKDRDHAMQSVLAYADEIIED